MVQKSSYKYTKLTDLEDVKNMVENARHNIETFVQQLVDTIDKMTELKQKTQPKLDALEQELKRAFTEQTTALTKELGDAKHFIEKTKRATTDSNNQSQQFVCSSFAAIATHKVINVNKRLECPDNSDISFTPYLTCEELF